MFQLSNLYNTLQLHLQQNDPDHRLDAFFRYTESGGLIQLLAQNNSYGPDKSMVTPKTPAVSKEENHKSPGPLSPGLPLGGGLGADLGLNLKPGDRRLSVLSNYAQRRTSIMSTGKFQGLRE